MSRPTEPVVALNNHPDWLRRVACAVADGAHTPTSWVEVAIAAHADVGDVPVGRFSDRVDEALR